MSKEIKKCCCECGNPMDMSRGFLLRVEFGICLAISCRNCGRLHWHDEIYQPVFNKDGHKAFYDPLKQNIFHIKMKQEKKQPKNCYPQEWMIKF